MHNRTILAKLWEQMDSTDILVITGARQAGKTSIMRLLEQRLRQEKNVPAHDIFFYDLENIADRQIFEDQALAQDRLTTGLSSPRFVFIDEFQRLSNVPSLLKYLHDHFPLLKFIISGSSSLSIKNAITESLLGRATTAVVHPLSFLEFLDFKKSIPLLALYQSAREGHKLSASEIGRLSLALSEMLTYGGYPRVVLTEHAEAKKKLLLEHISRYLEKDVQLLIREASLPIFEQLLSLLAAQDGGLLNITAVAKSLRAHQTTANRYARVLKETHLLNFLPAFSKDRTVETVKMRKVYYNDIGYVNALNKNFSYQPGTPAAGVAAENFALGELLKRAQPIDALYYWRTKQEQEVDFVWRRESAVVPIEVKSGTVSTVPSGLKSFIKRHRPKRAFVLNHATFAEESFDDCQILFRPLWWPVID